MRRSVKISKEKFRFKRAAFKICKRLIGLSLAVFIFLFFTGCIKVPVFPGEEPFGEKTASEDEAQKFLSDFSKWLEQKDLSGWDHSIEFSGDKLETAYWDTGEYVAAYASVSSGQEYLWYKGTLFLGEKEKITAREISWDDLEYAALAEKAEKYLRKQLAKQGELTYKYIPMAGNTPYMMQIEYPYAEVDLFDRDASFSIRVYSDEEGSPAKIYMCYNTRAEVKDGIMTRGSDRFAAAWELKEFGSEFYQAERRIWSFGYDYGLTDEENVVPALSYQKEHHAECMAVIESMDFEALSKKAATDNTLMLPDFEKFYEIPGEKHTTD